MTPSAPPHPILFQSIPFLTSPSSYVLLAPLFLFQPFQSVPSRPGASPGFPAQDRSGTSPGPPRCIPAWGCMGKGSGRGLAWAGSVAGPGAGPGPTHARIHFYSTQKASASCKNAGQYRQRCPTCDTFIADNPRQGFRKATSEERARLKRKRPAIDPFWCELCGVANSTGGWDNAKRLVQHVRGVNHRRRAMAKARSAPSVFF